MSLVIKKFQEGGSPEVRRYKRGNDEVDLDAFVRLAEAGFNDWLDKADIKEKHKNLVRAAYQDMITRINNDPESFEARLGGGFTNTAGITNKTKGFDAYGVAAGYLGNTLRSMSVYQKPEVKSGKQKYNRNSGLITSSMLEQILGNSPESFVKLDDDSYDEATGKRGLTNRIALTIAGLTAIKNNLRDYYDFDSDDDYNHAIARIDNSIATLLNSNPNDDWFSLSQLGLTGMDRYFLTGAERRTTPLTTEEQQVLKSQENLRNFENWMSSNRPFYTGDLGLISIGTADGTSNTQLVTELVNKLRSLSNKNLRNLIYDYIENPKHDLNRNPIIMRMYDGVAPGYGVFTSSLIMRGILALAIYNGLGKKITDTLYYFPDTLEKHADGSSTVFTYNVKTQSLDLVDTQDVKDYRKQYLNEYRNSNPSTNNYSSNSQYRERYPEMYPSHKLGGILKAQGGALFIGNIGHVDNYDWYTHGFNNWADALLNAAKSALDKLSFANLVNSTQAAHALLYSNWDKVRAYKGTDNNVGDYLQGIIDNFGYVNTSGISNIRKGLYYTDPENPNTTDNEQNAWKPDDYFAGQTDDRRVLGREGDFSEDVLNDLINKFKEAGYDMYLDDSDKYYKLRLLENRPIVKVEYTSPFISPTTILKPGELIVNKDKAKKELALKFSTQLDEKYTGQSSPNDSDSDGFLGELGMDLLGAGRLAGSILANNRIARTVRRSLRPKLHNTYELYSPVTGAFSEMQLRNRQGAETLSQAYKPFTSDASLAAARMLEGLRHTNDLQYQGYLADDKEIKRTQAEALKRQEDNIARRSALANENRDAIIANNQAKAQLEASRIKQNWQSIDNYLQGVESRVRNRIAENRDRRNQFLMQTGQFSALELRRARINEVMDEFRKYRAVPGNETKTLSDFNSATEGRYELAIAAINADYEMAQLANFGRVYGLKFTTPKDYKPYNIKNYNLTVRKYGGPIRLNVNQLINKIIRSNQ